MKHERLKCNTRLIVACFLIIFAAAVLWACGGPEYDPNVQVDANAIDADAALSRKILDHFTEGKLCSVGYKSDESEGRVLRLSSSGVKRNSFERPQICFEFSEFCKELGQDTVNMDEKPFVVMKVRAVNVHDRLVTVTGANTTDEYAIQGSEHAARISGDGYKYLVFDFSEDHNRDMFKVLKINFEQIAANNGEELLVSEIRFTDASGAVAYKTTDVYEISGSEDERGSLRVLSFNIQTEAGNSAPFALRAELFRNLVDKCLPDIAGLQEVTPAWKKWLDAYVFNESYASFGAERTQGGEANTIYYRKDKFDLLDSGTFWLSPTPDVPGSGYPNSAYVRICSWGVFRDKVTGREFVHYNLHLDINGDKTKAEGNELRADQISVIVRHAQRFAGKAIIVTGDFNTLRTTGSGGTMAAIRLMEGTMTVTDSDGNECSLALKDTRLNAPVTVDSDKTATLTKYHDKNYEKYEPGREPIDYVFYEPKAFEPLTYETFNLKGETFETSDHLAVFTTFRFMPQN